MQNGSFQNDVPREATGDNWIIVSLMLLALAYIVIRIIYHRYWKRYRQALFFNLEAMKLLQEKNVLLLQAAVSMNVLAVLSMGMFFYLFFTTLNIIPSFPNNLSGWLFTSGLLTLVISGKYMMHKILGMLGDNDVAAVNINHQWLIGLKNFGFFLLPVSAAAAFMDYPLNNVVIFGGLVLMLFMMIINYGKAFLILVQFRISIFYGILYLCTLEILPVLIIWKLIRLMT